MRANTEEYRRLDLRAHSLLADVPLHDVWTVELPGGGVGRTIVDLREMLSEERLMEANAAVKFLFWIRVWLGKVFGWDGEPRRDVGETWLSKLPDRDRELSLVEPGTPEGPFKVLFVSPSEAITEILNATVHGFSVFALVEASTGYRLYWGIYVHPVGGITAWYMRLIDPFRRLIVYPAMLRRIRSVWVAKVGKRA